MNHLSLAVFLVVFCGTVNFTYAEDDGEYEIISGDCNSALAKEMVYGEHVYKSRLPPLPRDATSSWSGSTKIYCIKVLNPKVSKGATCSISEGGLGYDHVTINMHSARGQDLEFDIEVYAN